MTDGKGTCILSDDVPVDNQTNFDANTFESAEFLLESYLGCKKVIWLRPMPNTSTGHVDLYAKLLTPDDILVIDFPSEFGNDGVADRLVEENVATLESEGFVVHRVSIASVGLTWIYKTYTNSVILNRIVMVPTYDDPVLDENALEIYQTVLGEDYSVVGIPSSRIVAYGGSVHCTTMQIASACGNGVREVLLFEECDGDDQDGATCESMGLNAGTLGCRDDCSLDVSGCVGGTGDTDVDSDTDVDAGGDLDDGTGGDAGADRDGGEGGEAELDGGCGCGVLGEKPLFFPLVRAVLGGFV